jgi:hypothetical protein
MDNENGTVDASVTEDVVTNTTEETAETSQENTADQSEGTEETIEEVKARLEDEKKARLKAEDIAKNQRIRAEKAEKGNKIPKEAPATNNALSLKDTTAIINAKVHEDDIEEVVEFARFKKIPISEALKNPIMIATLDQRSEQRNTAIATNTGSGRRGSPKVSDETLLSNANSGKLPESDDEIARLMKAKQGRK